MSSKLTTSSIARQNILNNNYALEEASKAVGLRGVLFNGEYKFTKQQGADFFEVTERTITNCITRNQNELRNNSYEILTGNYLKEFRLNFTGSFGREIHFPTKTTLFNITFRGYN